MKKIIYILIVVIFIVALVSAFFFINKPFASTTFISGEPIENSTLKDNKDFANDAKSEEIIPYLSDAEYEEKVLNYNGKVLIDFYTDWCYYCGVFSPIIEEVSLETTDVNFYRVNAEEEENIASTNRIIYYPTIILYENGVETNRYSGVLSKEELVDFIKGVQYEQEL